MNISIHIQNLKDIRDLKLDFPIEKGLYAVTGANGTGKSTIMTVFSKISHGGSLNQFQEQDYSSDTLLTISYNGKTNHWKKNPHHRGWSINEGENEIHIEGFYEGSLIHGVRFSDANYNAIVKAERIREDLLMDADDFVKENLSFILHGNKDFYQNLKRIKSIHIAKLKTFKGLPYFLPGANGLVNQYCMSTGENLLISLLHMLNVVIARKEKTPQIRLILIDEIELALHSAAIIRLVDFLQRLSNEYNLAIYFSSHSIELIRKIKPSNIYYLQKEVGNITVINPCNSAYAARDIYQPSGCDFLILVEDVLAKNIIETIIDENHLYKSKLIQVLPVGGWENVPRMHDDIVRSQLIGPDTRILSILDGDVEDDFNDKYKSKGLFVNLTINFLDIPSLEKYLLDKLVTHKDQYVFDEIGDRFFKVKSLKSIIDECQKKNDDKSFYRYLIKQVCELGIEEKVFVTHVCKIVYEHENMERNKRFLTRILTR